MLFLCFVQIHLFAEITCFLLFKLKRLWVAAEGAIAISKQTKKETQFCVSLEIQGWEDLTGEEAIQGHSFQNPY